MKLSDLNPRYLDGLTRKGVGIEFDCPCGKGCVPIYIDLANPLDGGPPMDVPQDKWTRTGESFDSLTLHPSINRLTECRWHGWVKNGNVTAC